MNMNCRVLLTLILLAIFDCQTGGKLIMKPENADIKVNDSTYFNCSTDIGSKDIFWFHGTVYVYIGSAILEPYNGRFEIDRNVWNGIYSYNLVIKSVHPSDAGEYICSDDEKYGEKHSVQLVVLDDDPICRSNRELDEVIGQNTCKIEPDEVELECSVTYHGNIPPQLEWKKVGENSSTQLEVSVATSRNHFISTLKFKGDIALNNSSYVCVTKRTSQEPIKCTSNVIQILYALSIDSTVNYYKTIDEEIHCIANTSQSCSYKWKSLQANNFTIESSTSVLKAMKTGWHECEAEYYLRNQTCILLVMRAMIAGHVYGESKSNPTGTIVVSVVLAVVFTLVVVGVLICIIISILRKKRRRADGNLNTPAEELPLLPKACQESDVIGNNYQFLVENINSSRLIDLLHENKCITSEERNHFNKQPDNFYRNDALLQWIRTITLNEEILQKVLECLRQAEQHLIADILGGGGAVIKSKIPTDLFNEQKQHSSSTNSSSTNADGLKELEAMVIGRLNQQQGLSLSSIQSATSDIPDADIVIAPYCHQEANGIVIWFWCHSTNGKENLQKMYESGILLDKLITVFKEFANDSVSSVSEILVPNSIAIFVGDFMKNNTIYGLAVLDQEVFIVRLLQTDIEVYDSMTFRLKRRMEVKGMKNPEDLVGLSCSDNNCLYAFDLEYQGQIHAILRIDPTNGQIITTWKIDERGGRLSVASDKNLILNINFKAKLQEYTSDGELVREIDLDPICTDIKSSWHALKLDNDRFVVCHGGEGDPLSRVCLLSVKSTSSTMGRTDEAEFVKAFGAERGKSIDRLVKPTYLSVNKEGSILVSDESHQTVLLSSNLDKPQIIVSEEHDLKSSRRTCFDKSTGQWFMADKQRVMVCRVKDEEVERKLYYLI